MTNPWLYFDKIICLNLPDRTDRYEQAQAEFERVGLSDIVEFVSAIPHQDGRIGLQNTLLREFMWYSTFRNILIFEDDVQFCNDPVNKLRLALNDLHYIFKDRYDLLYFGANLTQQCTTVTPNLKLLHHALSAHAVCYNHTVFDRYIKHLSKVVQKGRIESEWDISDVFLTTIQSRGKSLLVHPVIATQRPGYSDIEKKHTDYGEILKTK